LNIARPGGKLGLKAVHLGGGVLNFAISDTSKVQRAIDYFVEIAPNSNFTGVEIVHCSPSRNGRTIVPNGRWYVKAYSQYRLGGPPSEGLAHGPIVVTGSPISTLLPTQGCGTAQRFGHRTVRPSLQEAIARSYHAVIKEKPGLLRAFLSVSLALNLSDSNTASCKMIQTRTEIYLLSHAFVAECHIGAIHSASPFRIA